jgi:molybdate transport system regulatory protein
MKLRSKIWLEIKNEPVFGSGRCALLKAIDKYGSINKAAKVIHISYRKALSYIQTMEQRLGVNLVDRKAGGKNGGGATITENAINLIKKYEMLEHGVNETLDRKYSKIFSR